MGIDGSDFFFCANAIDEKQMNTTSKTTLDIVFGINSAKNSRK
jgi:hypothetical protein